MRPFVAIGFVLMALAVDAQAQATDTREDVRRVSSKPVVRGGIVFNTYCVLCHGEQGDGTARAAKLYKDTNIRIRLQTQAYYENIVRDGGKAVGLSAFMPAWRDELSPEQISDVVAYLDVVADKVGRGSVVFNTNCVLCHGVNGDGKGRASVLYNPPPADLTRSDKNDDYKRMITTLGGKAMGRSDVMPVWGEQLTPTQIDDVVAYLRTILKPAGAN